MPPRSQPRPQPRQHRQPQQQEPALSPIDAAVAALQAAAPEQLLRDPEALQRCSSARLQHLSEAAASVQSQVRQQHRLGNLHIPSPSALTTAVQLYACAARAAVVAASRAEHGSRQLLIPFALGELLDCAHQLCAAYIDAPVAHQPRASTLYETAPGGGACARSVLHFCGVLRTARALVRAQTLQALAALLAQAVQRLEAGGADTRGSQPFMSLATLGGQLGQVLGHAVDLTAHLLLIPSLHGAPAAVFALCRRVSDDIHFALLHSNILAHVCNAMLRAARWWQAAPPLPPPDREYVLDMLGSAVSRAQALLSMSTERDQSPLQQAGSAVVVQYCAATTLMEAVATAGDASVPTYGLVRPGVQSILSDLDDMLASKGRANQHIAPDMLMWKVLYAAAGVWSDEHFAVLLEWRRQRLVAVAGQQQQQSASQAPLPRPLFSASHSFDMLVRAVLAACAASLRAREQARRLWQQPVQQRLGAPDGINEEICAASFQALCRALQSANAALGAVPAGPQRTARVALWWRAACAALRAAVPVASPEGTGLADIVRDRLAGPAGARDSLAALCASPVPAELPVALNEGLLPACTAAMRGCATMARPGLGATAARALSESYTGPIGVMLTVLWPALMDARAPVAELAEALVALRKLLVMDALLDLSTGVATGWASLSNAVWLEVAGLLLSDGLEMAMLGAVRRTVGRHAHGAAARACSSPQPGSSPQAVGGSRTEQLAAPGDTWQQPACEQQPQQAQAEAAPQHELHMTERRPTQQAEDSREEEEEEEERTAWRMHALALQQLLPALMQYVLLQLQDTTCPADAAARAHAGLCHALFPCCLIAGPAAHQAIMTLSEAEAPHSSTPVQHAAVRGMPAEGGRAASGPGGDTAGIPLTCPSHAAATAAAAAAAAPPLPPSSDTAVDGGWAQFLRHTARVADVAAEALRYAGRAMAFHSFGPHTGGRVPQAPQAPQHDIEVQQATYALALDMAEMACSLLAVVEVVEPGTFRQLLAENRTAMPQAGHNKPESLPPLDETLQIIRPVGKAAPITALWSELESLQSGAEPRVLGLAEAPGASRHGLRLEGERIICQQLVRVLRKEGEQLLGFGRMFWQLCWLPPVAEAGALLAGSVCTSPLCTALAGDSEATSGVVLRACGRCGGPRYCSRECQVAHWRAGHKRECAGASAAAAQPATGTSH